MGAANWSAIEYQANQSKFLKIVPPLSLKNSTFPALTYNANGIIVIYTGPQPCSVGTADLYSPMTHQVEGVDPDQLAKRLNNQQVEGLDERETKEAIMVLLDKSNSMLRDSFSSKFEETEEELPEIIPNEQEIEVELNTLKHGPYLGILRRIASSKSADAVLQELAAQNYTLRFLANRFPEKLNEIIMQPKGELENLKEPTMQIFVRKTGGGTMTIGVDKSYSIAVVKRIAVASRGIAPSSVNFMYGGRYLNDYNTLEHYNIQKESTIIEMTNFSSVQPRPLTVEIKFSTWDTRSLELSSSETVMALKYAIWDRWGVKPSTVDLWTDLKSDGDGFQKGTQLTDNTPLGRFCTKEEDAIVKCELFTNNKYEMILYLYLHSCTGREKISLLV